MKNVLLYKFIATFVTLMFKYLVCILVCAILTLGLNATDNKELLKYQAGTMVSGADIPLYTGSYSFIPPDANHLSFCIGNDSPSADCISAYKICKGYIPGVSCLRQQTPLRILKCNGNMGMVRVLDSLDIPLAGNNGSGRNIRTDFVKFSYRYYIYALRKILI